MAKMPTPWPATPLLRVLAAPLIAMSALGGIGYSSASAADCQSWTGGQPPSPGSTDNRLSGIVALSACDAWAVGWEIGGGPSQTLVEHWGGSSWAVVPSPSPGTTINTLNSVRAASPTSIWAVGKFRSGGGDQTLILHWNGATWQQVPSPARAPASSGPCGPHPPTTPGRLVTTTTAPEPDPDPALERHHLDAGTEPRPRRSRRQRRPDRGSGHLRKRCLGGGADYQWQRRPDPDPALERHQVGTGIQPNPGTRNDLTAVGATSAKNAWAVGYTDNGSGNSTLVLHWNGTRWTHSASPNGPGTDSFLSDVVATSAGNALAVGGFTGGGSGQQTLVLRMERPGVAAGGQP